MKKIISLVLASVMMLCLFVSCAEKKKGDTKPELSSIIAARSEHYEIDGAMYAFFLYDYVGQYSDYLPMYGYDMTLSLGEQTSPCAFDSEKTWFEYFADMANMQINQLLAACEAAYAEGFALTEAQLAEIDTYIKELSDNAVKNDYSSLDELLAEYYIEEVTTETFKKCVTIQQLSYSFMNTHASSIEYTDEDLIKYRDEHPEKFLMIDVIQYGFFPEYDTGASEEEIEAAILDSKTRAESFLSQSKTVDAFKNGIVAIEQDGGNNTESSAIILSKYILDAEPYDADSAASEQYKFYYEWAFSLERKAGDTFLLEQQDSKGEKYYTTFCIIKPAYYYDYITKDCRHILFYVDNYETDKDKLEAAKTEALAKANAILNEFKGGNMTEADFKALEKKCLEDESAYEATAYYNVPTGYMVTEFENWIYGDRKAGDCEIVETNYGYHVVYFIGDGLPEWKVDAEHGYITDIMTQYQNEIVETHKVTYYSEAIENIP